MGRRERSLHELIAVKRGKKAYVWRAKWVYLGKWEEDGPSESAVERLKSLKELWKIQPSAPLVSGSLSFAELWRDWKHSPQGPRKRPEDVRRVELSLFGAAGEPGPFLMLAAKDFRPSSFLAWQTSLCEKGLSRWTVGQCRRLVLACFDWGSVVGKVDELLPAALARVKPPAAGYVKEAVSRTPVSESDFRKSLRYLPPIAKAACQLLWHTASRPSEILGNPRNVPPKYPITAADIVKEGTIRTAKGVEFELPAGLWAAVRTEHKMKRKGYDRVLFFGERGRSVLIKVLANAGKDGLLFPTRRGMPFNHKTLGEAIERACGLAKVPVYTAYAIRHGAAVVAQMKFPEAEVGVWLGHKSRATTAKYSGSDLRTAAKVAVEMG